MARGIVFKVILYKSIIYAVILLHGANEVRQVTGIIYYRYTYVYDFYNLN